MEITASDRIVWSGYSWLNRLHAAPRHQDDRKFWCDPSCVHVDPVTGSMHLLTRHNPMQFPTGFPQTGAGWIVSDKVFGYGTFEIFCQLPKGKWLWPAFWGTSKTWPPEVDMFEGYSDGKGSYRDFQWLHPCSPWAVRTNAFYGTNHLDHKQLGARQHSAMKSDPSNRFEHYRLEWTPKAMKIFFGIHEVRRITHARILSDFRKEGMVIVINNAIRDDAKTVDKVIGSDFVIKYFSYKAL